MSSRSTAEKERAAKEAADKAALERYRKRADPATIEDLLGASGLEEEYLGDVGKWKASWANVEFDDDACLKNVTPKGKTKDGFFAPAGSILPLGATFPDMLVLKYGGYFPAGTAFPGGVLIPLHARMVNLLPQQTVLPPPAPPKESLCFIQ